MVLILVAIDIKLDGYRLLWIFQRPIAYRTQDIGSWLRIIRFVNLVAITNNAFLITFTSSLSKNFFKNSLEIQLLFVILFQVYFKIK